MSGIFSRSASRVLQATLFLSLSIPALLPLLPGANAAPTTDPSVPTAPQQLYETRAEQPTTSSSSSRSSRLPVSALLAIVGASLFLVLLGTTLAYMYVRRRRANHKRAEHRKRTAQFQEMYRSGARPYHFAPGAGSAPVPMSQNFSATASEKRGPRYPIKAYVV